MIEEICDIWDKHDAGEVVCITTNGYRKTHDGHAVMGQGTALQAAQRWPDLPAILGRAIKVNNSIVQVIRERLVAFPVKPGYGIADPHNVVRHVHHRFRQGNIVPGWALVADLDIIATSLQQLDQLRQARGWERVYLPRPGCGAGELDWESLVRPVCVEYGDWLIVVDR